MSGDISSILIIVCAIVAAVSWILGRVAWENFKSYHWVFKVITALAVLGMFFFTGYTLLAAGR